MAINDPVVDKLIADAEAAVESEAGIRSVISVMNYASKAGQLCAVKGTDSLNDEPIWIICLAVDNSNLIPLARAIVGRESIMRFIVDNSELITKEQLAKAISDAAKRKMN